MHLFIEAWAFLCTVLFVNLVQALPLVRSVQSWNDAVMRKRSQHLVAASTMDRTRSWKPMENLAGLLDNGFRGGMHKLHPKGSNSEDKKGRYNVWKKWGKRFFLRRICFPGRVLDSWIATSRSWIPGQPLDRSWTLGQPSNLDFLMQFCTYLILLIREDADRILHHFFVWIRSKATLELWKPHFFMTSGFCWKKLRPQP